MQNQKRRISNVDELMDKMDQVWEAFDKGEISVQQAKVHIGVGNIMLKSAAAKSVYNQYHGIKGAVPFLENNPDQEQKKAPV